MRNSERRQIPRAAIEDLAYISLEPKNSGTVVNISDEGLCFHAVAPVQETGPVNFWFSLEGKRIEASGEVAWTDKTKKSGGLRFIALSAGALEQIRKLTAQTTVAAKFIRDPGDQAAGDFDNLQTPAIKAPEIAMRGAQRFETTPSSTADWGVPEHGSRPEHRPAASSGIGTTQLAAEPVSTGQSEAEYRTDESEEAHEEPRSEGLRARKYGSAEKFGSADEESRLKQPGRPQLPFSQLGGSPILPRPSPAESPRAESILSDSTLLIPPLAPPNDRGARAHPVQPTAATTPAGRSSRSSQAATFGSPPQENSPPAVAPFDFSGRGPLYPEYLDSSSDRGSSDESRRPFVRGLVTGIIAAVVAGAIAFGFHGYRQQVGDSLIQLGQRVAEMPGTPISSAAPGTASHDGTVAPNANGASTNAPRLSDNAAVPSPSNTSSSNSSASSDTQLPTTTASRETPLGSANNTDSTVLSHEARGAEPAASASDGRVSSKQPAPSISQPGAAAASPGTGNSSSVNATSGSGSAGQAADTGQSELALARQYLHGTSRPHSGSAAAGLLWIAVEKGNSTAEVTLADLYLSGDGVTKSCDQALVLLKAASDRGNVEAMQKLQDPNVRTCR